QGYDIMLSLCRGSAEQKAMAQDALNRWWWPSLMMFGPPDGESVHSAQSAPALPRPAGAAGRLPRHHDARSRSQMECGDRALRFRRDRLERIPQRAEGQWPVQPRTPRPAGERMGGGGGGARGG